MAFGFKFGGGGSVVQKLAAGKLKDDEKQTLLGQLMQQPPPAAELVPLLFVEDAIISSKAGQMFQMKADGDAVRELFDAMLESPTGAANALKVLQKCRDELVFKTVEAKLSDVKPDQARKLWEIALELQPAVSEKYLDRALQEAPAQQRVVALKRMLKSRGAESMRAVLINASSNPEAIVRKEAVATLATLAGEDVFNVMLDRLSSDDSKDVRDFAGQYLQSAIMKAPPEVRPRVLGRLLLAGEPETRQQLVKSMFGQANPGELLLGVLTFCKSLAGLQHRSVMDSLKAAGEGLTGPTVQLLKSPDVDLRVQAIYLLEGLGDPRSVGPLVAMLRDADWWVRIVACEALGKFKDPNIVNALREVFKDPDAKWAAIDAVASIGQDAAVMALLPMLKDPAPEVRQAVAAALAKVRDLRVENALHEVSSTDASIEVRLRAVESMRELKGGGDSKGGAVISSKDLTKPLEKMLAYLRERSGSDLHITPNEPPIIRVNGALERLPSSKLAAEPAKAALFEILDPVRIPVLEKTGAVDLCYSISGIGRYRANVFKMKRGYAGVFRTIPNRPPTLAELGLPKGLADIGTYHQGIVLVTGPAGCGKTTSLTALINVINETRNAHVLTFEDPVEFLHVPKKALINQREMGKDSANYASAMRGALREDPDVIVVGDMRDPETIRLALLASETGHLVIATMQTTGAVATIDKLVESFPPDEQPQVRAGLSESLKLIVSQILVPRADGQGRVGVFEVLKSTSSVRSLIRDGKSLQLPSTMVIGRSVGMMTLDGSLEERVRSGQVSFETAMQFAQSKEQFSKLKGISGASGGPAAAPAPSAGAPPAGAARPPPGRPAIDPAGRKP